MNVRLTILGVKQKLSDVLLNTSHEELIEVVSIQVQVLEKICDFIKSSDFKEKVDNEPGV